MTAPTGHQAVQDLSLIDFSGLHGLFHGGGDGLLHEAGGRVQEEAGAIFLSKGEAPVPGTISNLYCVHSYCHATHAPMYMFRT